jgi:hypothetical protein
MARKRCVKREIKPRLVLTSFNPLAFLNYLAVDHSPATQHRVVGVLLHGRPAKPSQSNLIKQ